MGIIIDDAEGILGDHNESDYFYASGKSAYLYIVRADLKVYNGGNAGSAGSRVDNGDEVSKGAYMLVNWDDDNSNAAPDLYEDSVGGEDGLARMEFEVKPDELTGGTVSFNKAGRAGSNVRIWESETKGSEITEPNWTLGNQPGELWLEGVSASSSERDINLHLSYSRNGAAIASDSAKATVVMVNLGNAVYRENSFPYMEDWGHSALVTKYTGTCTKDGLEDSTNFEIIHMQGSGVEYNDLANITDNSELPAYGCYTNPSIRYTDRLYVLSTIEDINDIGPGYTSVDILTPSGWDDTVEGIGDLRCDGLVEVCYEMNGIDVWGDLFIKPHYDIRNDSYQQEHNDAQIPADKGLIPVTQCGKADYWKNTEWKSTFSSQDLCEPIGHTGGPSD